ncbi:hypothetical protein [Zunongwangia profunda]|uniref:hypothetical protein n=1 Tax=Zunongwangia profunda TaxID=398743 RepID=UPI002356A9F2|nr:hypothetical protein [Zunongwangia profunda]
MRKVLLLFSLCMILASWKTHDAIDQMDEVAECDDFAEGIYDDMLDGGDQAMATEAYLLAFEICTYYRGGSSDYEANL